MDGQEGVVSGKDAKAIVTKKPALKESISTSTNPSLEKEEVHHGVNVALLHSKVSNAEIDEEMSELAKEGEGGIGISPIKEEEEEEEEEGEEALIQTEESDANDNASLIPALKELAAQAVDPRYGVPLNELVVALQEGRRRKAINLVQILINIKLAIRKEQNEDKSSLEKQMNNFYDQSWTLQKQLESEWIYQGVVAQGTNSRYTSITFAQADNEHQRQLRIAQMKIKDSEEPRCANLKFGFEDRETIRADDLANLEKLTSLLRSLYERFTPVKCKKGPFNGKICSSEAQGWCIFASKTSQDQRCSCQMNFYGPACEFKMCPGPGNYKFRADEKQVCSGNGTCNPMTGKCEKCSAGYFHGPKKTCELKHCPNIDINGSEKPAPDDKCSGHGKCNLNRGACECQYEWSGESCQYRKCPGANKILYPMTSGNACTGNGACDKRTGKCTCPAKFNGDACQYQECKMDCKDKGKCNLMTGMCACSDGYVGNQCQYKPCPMKCRGEEAGWCEA